MITRRFLLLTIGALVLISRGTSQVQASDPASREQLQKQVEAIAEKYKNTNTQKGNDRSEQPLSADEFDRRLRRVLGAGREFRSVRGEFDVKTNSFRGLEKLGEDTFDCHIKGSFYDCKAQFKSHETALASYGALINLLSKSTGSDPQPARSAGNRKEVMFFIFPVKGPLSKYGNRLIVLTYAPGYIHSPRPGRGSHGTEDASSVEVGVDNWAPVAAPSDSIADTISAIVAKPHSNLPEVTTGSGTGPITIWNDTPSVLTFYFSGGLSNKVEIGAFQRTAITIPPGIYNIAGTVANTAILPFAGVRAYAGGETEHFYVGSKVQ